MEKNMAKRKSGKTSKKGKSNVVFPLIVLAVLSLIIYYILYQMPNNQINDHIKPFKKKKQKETSQTNTPSSVQTKPDTLNTQKDQTSVPEDTTEIEVPKPSIREKSKLYFIDPKLPKICIIVDDFGQNDNALIKKFIELDENVAFSVIPGLKHSTSVMKKAVQAGHEIMIHAPLEPLSYPKDNPGDNAIFAKMTDQEIKSRIDDYMYQLNLAVGVNHHMGSKAASDLRVMRAIMGAIRENGLFYIDSYTGSSSVVEQVAREYKIPFARRQVFLDVPESSKHTAIIKIEEMQKMKVPVITIITHCHNDVKYRQLSFFIDRLKDFHYQIIPPSKAVKIYNKNI